jgi:hypothetical protein
VVVVEPTHPKLLVPVTVYVVVSDGAAVTVAPVVADRPVAGDHVYVAAPVAVSTIDKPAHIATFVPAVTTGNGLTVNSRVAKQPPGSVYVTVVVPSVPGVTTPEASIAAMPASAIVHEPPLTVLVSVVDEPIHTTAVPLIVDGNGFTVMVKEPGVPVHKLVFGVTLIVATTGVIPLFIAVKEGIIVYE